MICPCGNFTIGVRHMGHTAKLCTRCGRLMRLEWRTGRLVVVWPARRRAG